MAIEVKELYQGRPTNTATAVITGFTGGKRVITDIWRIENSAGTPTVTWYWVASGTTYDTTTKIYSEAFTANEVKAPMQTRIILEGTDQKFALGSSVTQQTTYTIFGYDDS